MKLPLKSGTGVRAASIPAEAAFTMVEIALSLAIIAFALVAIIGVLPMGLNVQRDNREETTLAQDGEFLMNAIRQGVNATNISILATNLDRLYYSSNGIPFIYSNGFLSATQIVSFLSMPTTVPSGTPGVFNVNNVMAIFRRFNGPLADQSSVGQPLALSYVVIPNVTNSLNCTNLVGATNNPNLAALAYVNGMSNNAYEVRLTLQSPFFGGNPPNVAVGPRRLVLHATVASQLTNTGTGFFFVPNTFIGP